MVRNEEWMLLGNNSLCVSYISAYLMNRCTDCSRLSFEGYCVMTSLDSVFFQTKGQVAYTLKVKILFPSKVKGRHAYYPF